MPPLSNGGSVPPRDSICGVWCSPERPICFSLMQSPFDAKITLRGRVSPKKGDPSLMLKLVLPTGSLEKPTLQMFEDAGLPVTHFNSRSYQGSIDDPRISSVRFMRPQEIPVYVAEGLFDAGISGLDWILERECRGRVIEAAELPYSRETAQPVRVVVAVAADSDFKEPSSIPPGSKVTTEYVNLARDYFKRLGIPVKIEFSYGTTEAKVPGIADVAVEITERGETLRANNLRIVDVITKSTPRLIVNPRSWGDGGKALAVEQIKTLLTGVLEARGKVLIKMNVPGEKLEAVLDTLPAMKAPTVAKLWAGDREYYAVESVAEKAGINMLIPRLKQSGAEDIIELPITKVVR